MREAMARGIDTKPYLEWLDGVESVALSPNLPHGGVAVRLACILVELGDAFGETAVEPHVRVSPGTILLPDVAFFRLDALAAVPREERLIPAVPAEVVAEVRSPHDRPGFRDEKIRRYIAWGAGIVLDIDPSKRTLVAHSSGGTRAYASGDRFRHDAVPWLQFELPRIFARIDLLER